MIVGIDLGTTHSLIGCYDDGGPRLFPNVLGGFLTPSVVSVDETGQVLIGQTARDRLVSHPDASVAGFKRWMGTSRETRLGAHSFRPEELSALILRSLIGDAETALGETVREAVISVPAYFSDAQRKATRAAGELAGIRVERLINEPTAAALAYGLRERPDGARFLVLDLGGGTFDVSVLEMFAGVVEVHASAGDNFLGGEDFLDLLEHACRTDLGLDPVSLAASQRAQLRRRLEAAKCALGSQGHAGIEMMLGTRQLAWQIDEARFHRLAEPLVQRMRAPLERAMRDARLQPQDLDEIVLVGGASRMPLVAKTVSRMFGRLPLRHVNPDQAIAQGACVAAGMKSRDQRLEEVILTDVCPYSLGTEIARRDDQGRAIAGFFEPIIQRNSTVPISREQTFLPINARQQQLQLDVYQGESPLVEKNIKLGELTVDINPALSIEQNAVTMRFTYDINGVLQVEARVHADDRRYELVLEQNPGLLDAEQIRERLAALADIKIHPRGKQENLAMLARAERLYEECLTARDQLQGWIARFRAVLESQDEAVIRTHRLELGRALDTLESD
ncbi:molecular chaperone HscC [Rhodanobacter sp. TND4EL1]